MYWSVTTHNIDVVQANDGGYVMMNTGTGYWNANGSGIWIVKTDANGIITSIDETKFFKEEIKIYPNPSKDKLNIEFANSKEVEIAIYTITGIQVYSEKLNNIKLHQLSIEHLPRGMYILHATQPNKLFTKKIIKN